MPEYFLLDAEEFFERHPKPGENETQVFGCNRHLVRNSSKYL
jgi:hypothetical protein